MPGHALGLSCLLNKPLTLVLWSIDSSSMYAPLDVNMYLCVVCTDRNMVSTHLPLAWTHSSPLEEQKLMSVLEDLAKTFQPHWDSRDWLAVHHTNTIRSYWPRLGSVFHPPDDIIHSRRRNRSGAILSKALGVLMLPLVTTLKWENMKIYCEF